MSDTDTIFTNYYSSLLWATTVKLHRCMQETSNQCCVLQIFMLYIFILEWGIKMWGITFWATLVVQKKLQAKSSRHGQYKLSGVLPVAHATHIYCSHMPGLAPLAAHAVLRTFLEFGNFSHQTNWAQMQTRIFADKVIVTEYTSQLVTRYFMSHARPRCVWSRLDLEGSQ